MSASLKGRVMLVRSEGRGGPLVRAVIHPTVPLDLAGMLLFVGNQTVTGVMWHAGHTFLNIPTCNLVS